MPNPTIRCLVVDDAALMRATIRRMLETDPQIQVIETAGSGPVALQKIKNHRPDVVTLDVEMPGMDGITLLRRIMEDVPTPVVMLSSHTQEGAQRTLDALQAGAVECIGKPTGTSGQTLGDVTDVLIEKVKAAAVANMAQLRRQSLVRPTPRPTTAKRPVTPPTVPSGTGQPLIAVGISAGGPATLVNVFAQLPAEVPPILITQHMPPGFTKSFADRLNRLSALEVREAAEGDLVRPGLALIAPGHAHMIVRRHMHTELKIKLDDGPPACGHKPSVDQLFRSVAQNWKGPLIGLIMTGMGCDGSEAISAIRAAGGRTYAQSQDSCVVYGMPKVAIDSGHVDEILDLEGITALLSGAVPVPA